MCANTCLDGTLAGVQKVLKRDQFLVGLDEVHAGLVVGQEDGGVRLQHRVELASQTVVPVAKMIKI